MYIFGLSIPLMLLLWHFICCILSIVEYVIWIRKQSLLDVGGTLRGAHLAFDIIGIVGYSFGGAPLFVYAYKYGLSYSKRRTRLLLGMAVMFIVWSFPIFIIEFVILVSLGGRNYPLDGIVFILSIISSILDGFCIWFGYMRFAAHCIHHYRGIERQIDPRDSLTPYPMQPVRLVAGVDQPDTI
ncbi:uncharacterized protein TM35_000162780 [Trypanosoma theileri]|uniref:Uncharacterized protein n=1 Tax=Trypanosoma theileri TaxID=67003 RepID=A0A1X0NX01_9TRYP|nr:uncharacterized protein TM35_000162780 [Trypanosoma theileri]ORC88640.1 hypothetical protein TM35_000162780 [Trypanosoma theileri]